MTPVPGLWGSLITVAVPAPPRGFFDHGFGRFLVSPGFGGLAAFLAALLVFIAAQQRNAHDRRELARAQEKDRQERWWEALTWVYDRASTERVEARLTTDLVLDLLDRLLDEAHTDLEVQAVAGLIEGLQDRRGDT